MIRFTRFASLQPVPAWHALPLSTQRSDPFSLSPQGNISLLPFHLVELGKFWSRPLVRTVRPCTALYGRPYHSYQNSPSFSISSPLQLLFSPYQYNQLNSTKVESSGRNGDDQL
ncbi:hypothetical protein YC2023_045218 [Brassica napus]